MAVKQVPPPVAVVETTDDDDTPRAASPDSEADDSSETSETSSAAQDDKPQEQPSLQSRLAAFLPQLAAANKELEDLKSRGQIDSARLDNVGNDEERYIEMDLGLGVLEERRDGDSDASSESESSDEEEAGDETKAAERKETHRLAKLMGQAPSQDKPGIQEMDHDEQIKT